MNTLSNLIDEYLQHCRVRKDLDPKTIRAYKADLTDFEQYITQHDASFLDKKAIGDYVDLLHYTKAPRTVKRKISSLQAFYHYLIYAEKIVENPLYRLDLSFRLPQRLPRYIPNHIMNTFYQELYSKLDKASTTYQLKCAVRNIAVIELLFATGLRISELCELTKESVNLYEQEMLCCCMH